ncbi:sigma-54-dependent transcriptional regulator [Aliikangiella coralliicola]|uniref:Sigma-54-dependent Fis family transcriptional regulator n=1 Tax=Aliikangiella coralliicola TaxID=2592383 RepID=A0A545UJL5_9GAMM|nr:sigma-54 dependent transcriptional regulator [Aliikangiella coralliicola]TQV89649.1 sigma-54-dependent Fis family transcriptional regulator [Aliikangiella coralliicola]
MKQNGCILVVDDNQDILTSSRLLLKQHYQTVKTLSDPEKMIPLLKQSQFNVVLLDMNFTRDAISGREGFYWLEKILTVDPTIVVVMMTAYTEIKLVVEAIKAGASDFIAKPCPNEQLLASIAAALKISESKQKLKQLSRQTQGLNQVLNDSQQPFLGESPAMQKVFTMIEKVAETDASVLILGESGTGKELTARALHQASPRAGGAFISLDMGTISENLFESELFGHKKGAFTDAKTDRVGRFELAKGGSLFLDELGNLPIKQQVKLLAALQNQEITPVGENKPIKTDIRLICATNDNLHQAAIEGRFRQDLLFRVNTVEIHLPPLRERLEDIPLLANYYLQHFCRKYRREVSIPDSEMRKLKHYSWPGNVRELSHVIERAVILNDGNHLQITSLQDANAAEPSGQYSSTVEPGEQNFNLSQVEELTIQNALAYYEGNVSKVAKATGLTRGALYRRLEKYGL